MNSSCSNTNKSGKFILEINEELVIPICHCFWPNGENAQVKSLNNNLNEILGNLWGHSHHCGQSLPKQRHCGKIRPLFW